MTHEDTDAAYPSTTLNRHDRRHGERQRLVLHEHDSAINIKGAGKKHIEIPRARIGGLASIASA